MDLRVMSPTSYQTALPRAASTSIAQNRQIQPNQRLIYFQTSHQGLKGLRQKRQRSNRNRSLSHNILQNGEFSTHFQPLAFV